MKTKDNIEEIYEQVAKRNFTNPPLSNDHEVEVSIDSCNNPTQVIITEKVFSGTQGKSIEVRCNRINL